jgi:hypothetical protein
VASTEERNMGCDIHMYAEVRNKKTNKWEKVGKVFKNEWYDPEQKTKVYEEHGYEWNAQFTDQPYDERNYDVFAVLAGVRRDATPIDKPRGLPEDISDEVKQIAENDPDGHSYSYLTLKELLSYNWKDENTSHFANSTLPKLQKLGRPEDVRIVFYFDN